MVALKKEPCCCLCSKKQMIGITEVLNSLLFPTVFNPSNIFTLHFNFNFIEVWMSNMLVHESLSLSVAVVSS